MSESLSESPVVVLGAGGHGKVVVSTLQAAGIQVSEVWDDDPDRWRETVLGVPVKGPIAARARAVPGHPAILGIGDNRTRQRFAEELSLEWMTVVHPGAVVHPSVRLGAGTAVFAGAVVQPDARVGRHVIVNTCASIDHDSEVGDFVHLAPGCRLGGDVHVEEGALVGLGAVVLPGRTVGGWATVGAGSAVVRNAPPERTVLGVPARPIPAS